MGLITVSLIAQSSTDRTNGGAARQTITIPSGGILRSLSIVHQQSTDVRGTVFARSRIYKTNGHVLASVQGYIWGFSAISKPFDVPVAGDETMDLEAPGSVADAIRATAVIQT